MPDVLAVLRGGYAPDGGGAGDGGTDGQAAGGSGAGGAGDGAGGTGSDGTPFDAERAQRTIAALREKEKAGAQAARERDDLAARLKAIEDKDKTDSERLAGDLKSASDKLTAAEKKAAELEAKYTGALIGAAIEREAGKLGAVDAETVAALVDRSEIKIDEAGVVTGADKAVAALLKAKPFLVKTDGGVPGGMKSTPGTPNGAGGATQQEKVTTAQKQLQSTGMYGRL
jgi:hypothetical protein